MWWGTAIEAPDPGGLARFQPQENVRTLLDPAGHPFCLCLDQG